MAVCGLLVSQHSGFLLIKVTMDATQWRITEDAVAG